MKLIPSSTRSRKRGFSRRGSTRARNYPPITPTDRRRDPARFGKAFRASELDMALWRRVTRQDWFINARGSRNA